MWQNVMLLLPRNVNTLGYAVPDYENIDHPDMKLSPTCIKLAIFLVVIGFSGSILVHLLTEVWWFDAVGFTQVFWTRLTWQILIWVVTFIVYVLFLGANYRLAMRGKHQSHLPLKIDGTQKVSHRRDVNYAASERPRRETTGLPLTSSIF